MKKIAMFALMIISMFVLAACGNSDEEAPKSGGELPEIIEAKLDVPEKGDVNTDITFSVVVTQGNEPVEDASEVEFEIWTEGNKEDSELILATHEGEGKYVIEKSFSQNGIYTVQSHVTARDMHTMPKASIQIGEVTNQESEGHEGSSHHDEESETDAHHEHNDGVAIHFLKEDSIHLDEETSMSVHVTVDDAPLSDAEVKLEMFLVDSHDHQWVDLKQMRDGEYQVVHTFTTPGTYTVVVHVSNSEGIHEHIEETVEVS